MGRGHFIFSFCCFFSFTLLFVISLRSIRLIRWYRVIFSSPVYSLSDLPLTLPILLHILSNQMTKSYAFAVKQIDKDKVFVTQYIRVDRRSRREKSPSKFLGANFLLPSNIWCSVKTSTWKLKKAFYCLSRKTTWNLFFVRSTLIKSIDHKYKYIRSMCKHMLQYQSFSNQ